MKMSQINLLTKRQFLPLFITQFLGAFNDNTFKNALVILITYRLADVSGFNSQILVTLAAGIFILPFFIFSAMAGQLADKYEKSLLIKVIKFVEIILMMLATAGFYFQSVSLLMLVLFMLGMHATFFGPLKYAILPEHLEENELIAGNGLIEAGTFLSILIGTIFGGIFILLPFGETIISAIIVTIAIGGWIASWRIPKTKSFNPSLSVSFNIVKETSRVIRYSRERWDIFITILGISWFWLVGATFLAEFPVFGKEILHANENVVTFFLALFSIGIGIGSLFCNQLLKGKIHATYVPLGVLGMTLFMVDLYFTANHFSQYFTDHLMTLSQFLQTTKGWHITVDLLLIAFCGGIYTVPLYAILQQRSDKEHRARVIASNNVINALFMVLAAIITTLLLKLGFSVSQVFLIIAIGNGIVAIYICKLLPDILIRGFFHWLLTSLFRVKIKGLENYHNAGERIVIVANHTSFIDAILLATFLPDKLTFAVNRITARKWWIKLFLRMVDAYPMDPTNPMALKSLIEFVRQDKRCVIFPEGRLTVTGALMKIYEGPGMVADKSKAKLLPIRIDGAQYTIFSRMRGKIRLQFFPKITVTIFPPEVMAIAPEMKGRKRRQHIGYQLYDLMRNVMLESSHYSQTLFDALIDAKKTHGSRHDIMEDTDRAPINYKTFITRCFILGGIIAKKTQVGEHVGVLLPNMISNITTFFALQAFCRIPAMINFSTGINNAVIACQTAQIKTIYSSRKFIQLAKLTEMANAMTALGINIIYLEDVREKVSWFDKIKGLCLAQLPRFSYRLVNSSKRSRPFLSAEKAAVVLFTSGSEGTPKGVVLSHSNIQANRFQLSASVDFTATDKVFNALPIFHSFGLTGGTLLPLLSGIKIFFYPSPLHYRIIPELSYDTNATILFGTDTFLINYARYAHPYDFYSIRYVFAGAEKLREETRTIWSQKFGVRIFEGYGTTETSPVISTNTPMQNKINTVGRLLPGIRYQLIPVPGVEEGGILKISGPNVMKGYFYANNPGVLVSPEQGWYETGDIVSFDEMGFITIKGRVKRFAKIAGEMISLPMVEEYLSQLWPTHQHAVVSIPCPKKTEQLILVTTYPDASREEMIRYAKQKNIGEINIPKTIMTMKEMLVLGTGKIDYVGIKNFVLAK